MTDTTDINAIVRHGAYMCLSRATGRFDSLADAPVDEAAARLRRENEWTAAGGPRPQTLAFLRRLDVTPRDIADPALSEAEIVVHVSAEDASLVGEFLADVEELVGDRARVRTFRGVVRPARYTGLAMHDFAYARQLTQQPGVAAPHAFIVPMSKTDAWWRKDWMERHTYFLPRYDAAGRMTSQGHALAAAAGIPRLLRRTYRWETEPAPAGEYDFVNYFECADEAVATFHDVCAALRDVTTNPEWSFVHEGPTWHGARAPSWRALFE